MNIFLLSLIDKTIEGVMTRFSLLPVKSSLLNQNHHEILAKLAKKVIDTYIQFFQCVNIVPKQYCYHEGTIVKRFNLLDLTPERYEGIEKKLVDLIIFPLHHSLIPVHLHLHKSGQVIIYSGIGILESASYSVVFFLYELSIAAASIHYSPSALNYLEVALDTVYHDDLDRFKPLRKLATDLGKNYNQFQNDCKDYFGDTFHRFHNKMKMLDVIGDIVFTNYNFKEIAYQNDFSNYNSMYFLFRKKYGFPIHTIPRILNEI